MHRLLVILLLALPCPAEWLALEIHFQGTGCAACVESLPQRVRRMRGVESAEVDAERSVLKVKLAAGNRVRLELVRDQIEQDGTKVTRARVEALGVVEKAQNRQVFRLAGLPLTYTLEGDPANHLGVAVRLAAIADTLRPEPVLRILEITAQP